MPEDVIERSRRNLLLLRGELEHAKSDLRDERAELDLVLVGVEVVKADAMLACAELLARISEQLGSLGKGGGRDGADDPDQP